MDGSTVVFPALTLVLVSACGVPQSHPDGENAPFLPPAGFIAMPMGNGIHVTWQDTFSGESGFELQRKSTDGEFVTLLQLPADSEAHHDLTVEPGVRYAYRVRVVRSDAQGAWSAEAAAKLEPPAPTTGAPEDLFAEALHGGLHLGWSDNSSNETGFELQRRIGTAEYTTIAEPGADEEAHMDGTVLPGVTYTYRIRAKGPDGDSAWSAEATGTP